MGCQGHLLDIYQVMYRDLYAIDPLTLGSIFDRLSAVVVY